MAAHYRSGHWRRSRNGGYHFVGGHTVNRFSSMSFVRSALTGEPEPQPKRASPTLLTSVFALRYAQRNAACPVCGAMVFFYSNSYGSRVYFDDLGPPWPKHPCTDTRQSGGGTALGYITGARDDGQAAQTPQAPSLRSTQDIRQMRQALVRSEALHPFRGGVDPVLPLIVMSAKRSSQATIVEARDLLGGGPVTRFTLSGPLLPSQDTLVYLDGAFCSYVDTATAAVVRLAYTLLSVPWVWQRR